MRKSVAASLLLLSLISSFASPSYVQAQTKVAYLDASKILKRMPEATDAQSRLDQLVAGWNHDAEDMQNELNRKQSDFDRRKLIMTDAERTAAEVDLQNIRKRLDEFRHSKYDTPNGELYTQETALMKPAYDRLAKAIDEAAHEGSYDYVLDRSSRDVMMLYSNSKYDLTIVVARKLGIETDILSTPLINTAPKTAPGGGPGGAPGKPGQSPSEIPQPNGSNGANPGMSPNPGINTVNSNPNGQGSFNTGSYNPDQIPTPPQKSPASPTH